MDASNRGSKGRTPLAGSAEGAAALCRSPRRRPILPKLTHGIDQAHDVAGSVRAPAVAPAGVVDQLRHMVVDQEAAEADLLERAHGRDDIDIAFAQEALLEHGHMALHIAEVDIHD